MNIQNKLTIVFYRAAIGHCYQKTVNYSASRTEPKQCLCAAGNWARFGQHLR